MTFLHILLEGYNVEKIIPVSVALSAADKQKSKTLPGDQQDRWGS
jgi:hypothetical protein